MLPLLVLTMLYLAIFQVPVERCYMDYYELHIMKQPVLKICLPGLKQTMRIQH